MKYWKRHLKKNQIKFLCVLLILIVSCEAEQTEQIDFIARINDEYLLQEYADKFLEENENDSTALKQYVRKWVRRKVLLDEAVKRDLINDSEYVLNIESIKEDILISSLINELLTTQIDNAPNHMLINFFKQNEDLFVLKNNLYEMNVIVFTSENMAYKFRNIEAEEITTKLDIYNAEYNQSVSFVRKAYRDYDFPTQNYYNAVKSLQKRAYSVPILTEQNSVHVVQMINRYDQGTIPEFELILKDVKELFILSRKKEIINNFVSQSLDEYDIEIREELN